eukprot:symbB.v1.2.000265.t1/scaffold20.1/size571870/10
MSPGSLSYCQPHSGQRFHWQVVATRRAQIPVLPGHDRHITWAGGFAEPSHDVQQQQQEVIYVAGGLHEVADTIARVESGGSKGKIFLVNAALGELLSKCHVVTPIHLDASWFRWVESVIFTKHCVAWRSFFFLAHSPPLATRVWGTTNVSKCEHVTAVCASPFVAGLQPRISRGRELMGWQVGPGSTYKFSALKIETLSWHRKKLQRSVQVLPEDGDI